MKRRKKVKRILFVVPPLRAEKVDFYPDFPTPPLGIAYIGASVGVKCEKDLIDFSFEEDWTKIEKYLSGLPRYDLCAFTSMTLSFDKGVRIAEQLRKYQECPFVIGGSHETVFPQAVLEASPFDIAVLGEGEVTFRELVERGACDLDSIRGIAYRDVAGRVKVNAPRGYVSDLDSIQFPDRDLLPMDKYIAAFSNTLPGERGTTVIGSRGCPFECAFCAKEIFGRKLRSRSPANILAEIELLLAKYSLTTIHFVDDTFITGTGFVREFCEEKVRKGLDFLWRCEARVDSLNDSVLQLMSKNGCVGVMCGVESGAQEILDAMNKKQSVDQILNVCDAIHRNGIDLGVFIILGYPGETAETLAKTIALVRKIKPTIVAVSFATLLPGTQMYSQYFRGSEASESVWRDYHVATNFREGSLSFDELCKARREIFGIVWGGNQVEL